MLKIIQIISLIQGLFVLFLLYNNRKNYKNITFWLLYGSLFSIILYIIGDDKNNLFVKNTDWFFFDNTLFVTFLLLFFKYFESGKEKFIKLDSLFFIPNLFYFILEIIEISSIKKNLIVDAFEIVAQLIFIIYLSIIIYSVFTSLKKIWIIYFVIPIAILFIFSCINDILKISKLTELPFFSDQNFNSYLILFIGFLFYFVAFKLVTNDTEILPKIEISKYKNSILTDEMINDYKTDLLLAMQKDKLFLNGKLSIQDVSEKLNIPRQYISEVLNEHMNTNFQDFINQYRVEEFINRLQKYPNNRFTLLAIATEVGFNSKSSFNATFKKIKGLTPTEFKKNSFDKQ